jgi:pimeloyl-ACP methyl ester carboxylesterase
MTRRLLASLVTIAVVVTSAYMLYAGYEGSRRIVDDEQNPDCRTPASLGWTYEAVNYDIADDGALATAYASMERCSRQGVEAGDEVVTPDGVRVAGWYIPAARPLDATAPTIVLVHGRASNKSRMLPHASALHDRFNLLLIDLRNSGRSSRAGTTWGVREQHDLRAMIDWLERTKRPSAIGVLGQSSGASTAITLARTEPRIRALALDSVHASFTKPIEQVIPRDGRAPAYPGIWAIWLGVVLRTGANLFDADPVAAMPALAGRPLLLLYGTRDDIDVPEENAFVLAEHAREAGVPVELRRCEGARHAEIAHADGCMAQYREWLVPFFAEALG